MLIIHQLVLSYKPRFKVTFSSILAYRTRILYPFLYFCLFYGIVKILWGNYLIKKWKKNIKLRHFVCFALLFNSNLQKNLSLRRPTMWGERLHSYQLVFSTWWQDYEKRKKVNNVPNSIWGNMPNSLLRTFGPNLFWAALEMLTIQLAMCHY